MGTEKGPKLQTDPSLVFRTNPPHLNNRAEALTGMATVKVGGKERKKDWLLVGRVARGFSNRFGSGKARLMGGTCQPVVAQTALAAAKRGC